MDADPTSIPILFNRYVTQQGHLIMKAPNNILISILSLAVATCGLTAESLILEFTDATNDEPQNAFYGDVSSGLVVMDTSSGAYSVTWNAANGAGFLGPMRFELNLINIHAGNAVSLTGVFEDALVNIPSFTYEGTEAGLINWSNNQTVLTGGSHDGQTYLSGIYSTEFGVDTLRDSVETTGQLAPNPDSGSSDPDSDGDGIPDSQDGFAESDTRPTVFFLGEDTHIPNQIDGALANEDGYTLADLISMYEKAAAAESKNNGQYIQKALHSYRQLVKDGTLTQMQFMGLVRTVVKFKK